MSGNNLEYKKKNLLKRGLKRYLENCKTSKVQQREKNNKNSD